jgi:hypothetical protein
VPHIPQPHDQPTTFFDFVVATTNIGAAGGGGGDKTGITWQRKVSNIVWEIDGKVRKMMPSASSPTALYRRWDAVDPCQSPGVSPGAGGYNKYTSDLCICRARCLS